jgi:hypothetical protein
LKQVQQQLSSNSSNSNRQHPICWHVAAQESMIQYSHISKPVSRLAAAALASLAFRCAFHCVSTMSAAQALCITHHLVCACLAHEQELQALITYIQMNKDSDTDWFTIQPEDGGKAWKGKCWCVAATGQQEHCGSCYVVQHYLMFCRLGFRSS